MPRAFLGKKNTTPNKRNLSFGLRVWAVIQASHVYLIKQQAKGPLSLSSKFAKAVCALACKQSHMGAAVLAAGPSQCPCHQGLACPWCAMKQNAPVADFFDGQGLVTSPTVLAPVIALATRVLPVPGAP